MSDEDFLCADCMSLLQIRDLFSAYGSYLAGQILDVDEQLIDPALLLFTAAQDNSINPQFLLAKLQGENSSIKRTTRPDDTVLRTLLGCGGGGNSRTSIRAQISCAAQALKTHYDAQLLPNGHTINGWRVGVPKKTNQVQAPGNPVEDLWVTPATKATAAFYAYTPYRGERWGGVAGGNALLVRVLRDTLKLYALRPSWGHEYYDENGTLIHRFLTHNAKTGEYTFDWSIEPTYNYDSWDNTSEFAITGITGYLPGRTTYNVTLGWDLRTFDYCKRSTDPGDPQDYDFYNGDCFVAAINQLEYGELKQTWQPSWFTTYSANIMTEPGYMALEGGLTKPATPGPYAEAARTSKTNHSVTGTPGEGRILNVVQDSEYRLEYPTFPSWGKVTVTIK